MQLQRSLRATESMFRQDVVCDMGIHNHAGYDGVTATAIKTRFQINSWQQ